MSNMSHFSTVVVIFVLALCSLMHITHTCTTSKFESAAKACVVGFARNLRESRDKTCRNHYDELKNCLRREFNVCKNFTGPETQEKIINIGVKVVASEQYYCTYGGIKPFTGKIVRGCPKKAQKKMRKCSSTFHKHFNDDSGSTSLCRRYAKAKKCVIRVAKKLCERTNEVKSLIEIFKDPFNPYCSAGSDVKKPVQRSSFSSPFGSCTRREYLTRSRDCLANFIQRLQKYPKKPCGLVFKKRLHNCAKKVALDCYKNDTSYNKKRIETEFEKTRSLQQRRYCDGFQFQFPYPAVKLGQCAESYFERRKKCSNQFVEAYIKNKTEKSLCGKYAEAKRCAKNVTLTDCDVTSQLEDDVDFIYDKFNPFCARLKDPSRGGKRPQKLEKERSPSRGKSNRSKVSILIAILCSILRTIVS